MKYNFLYYNEEEQIPYQVIEKNFLRLKDLRKFLKKIPEYELKKCKVKKYLKNYTLIGRFVKNKRIIEFY